MNQRHSFDEQISFSAAAAEDFDRLFDLRITVMRKHLERLGRFDLVRARTRFEAGFAPEHTRLIHLGNSFSGCVTLRPHAAGMELEHFYLAPDLQGQGVGGRVLALLLTETDRAGHAVRVGVLKHSPTRRFYERHGFLFAHDGEWDDYLVREPRNAA